MQPNKAIKELLRTEAANYLKYSLKPGDTVYCIVRSVSASGMSRTISLLTLQDGWKLSHSYNAATLLGRPFVSKNGFDAVRVNGCGMDMCQHLVDGLSYELFGKENVLKAVTL